MGERLSGPARVRSKTEFEKIFRHGTPLRGKHLSVWIRITESDGPVRVGLVVGRAVSRLAVVRNRWKRQLREAAKQAEKDLPRGCEIVLKPLAGQKNIPSRQLQADLERIIINKKGRS